MTKRTDYAITCVKLTANGDKIATVGVHVDEGDKLGTRATWHRSQVVDKLDENHTFVTAIKDTNDKWKKGAKVKRYKVGSEWFIKTVANNKAEDNLGNLPEC